MIAESVTEVLPSQVCAIGILLVDLETYRREGHEEVDNFAILGTGFLVSNSMVATADHVIGSVNAALTQRGLLSDRRYLLFHVRRGQAMDLVFRQFQKVVRTEASGWDLALIQFSDLPDDGDVLDVTPVTFRDNFSSKVGDRVALLGFPLGQGLFKDRADGRWYRFGPVLYQGSIAAIAPFDNHGQVERWLLDIRTASGMSGAPLIDTEQGDVIGIHDRGGDLVVFASPLSRARVTKLLRELDLSASGPQDITVPNVRRLGAEDVDLAALASRDPSPDEFLADVNEPAAAEDQAKGGGMGLWVVVAVVGAVLALLLFASSSTR